MNVVFYRCLLLSFECSVCCKCLPYFSFFQFLLSSVWFWTEIKAVQMSTFLIHKPNLTACGAVIDMPCAVGEQLLFCSSSLPLDNLCLYILQSCKHFLLFWEFGFECLTGNICQCWKEGTVFFQWGINGSLWAPGSLSYSCGDRFPWHWNLKLWLA